MLIKLCYNYAIKGKLNYFYFFIFGYIWLYVHIVMKHFKIKIHMYANLLVIANTITAIIISHSYQDSIMINDNVFLIMSRVNKYNIEIKEVYEFCYLESIITKDG